MNKKLKDTDSKKTEKLSNRLTVLRSELKTIIASAFIEISDAGKVIDNYINQLRDSLRDVIFYQLEILENSKNTKMEDTKKTYMSFQYMMDELYTLSGKEKADYRDTYFHKALSVVAYSVVLLCDAKNNNEIRVKVITEKDVNKKSKMLVNSISLDAEGKKKKAYTLEIGDLAIEYNFLKPSFKVLDEDLSTENEKIYVDEPNQESKLIPFTKEAVKKIYYKLHPSGKRNIPEDTGTPNPQNRITFFEDVCKSNTSYFLEGASNEDLLADFNASILGKKDNQMKSALQKLEKSIVAFKQSAEDLLAKDSDEKQVGTVKKDFGIESQKAFQSVFAGNKKQVNKK